MEKTTLIDRLGRTSIDRISETKRYSIGNENKLKEYLFVQQFLEKPVYKGDVTMLTIPSACTFRGVPLLDDW